jgi:hypothetical protein
MKLCSNEVVFLNADGVRMDMMSLVTGLLIGILGGLGLGVGTVALDRRRLLRTLLARANQPNSLTFAVSLRNSRHARLSARFRLNLRARERNE